MAHITNQDAEEVALASARYEAALVANDIETMNEMFLADESVIRFGVNDMQFGFDAVVAWRAGATPVDPSRRITSQRIESFAPGVVTVDITFVDGDAPFTGRQSQTWTRRPEGWRIVRAHVSVIPDHTPT